MKRIINYSYLTLFLLLSLSSGIEASNASTTTLLNAVDVTDFDPVNREFFVGLAVDAADTTQKFGKFSPVEGTDTPSFTSLYDTTSGVDFDATAITHMKYFRIGSGSTAGRFLALTNGATPLLINVAAADTTRDVVASTAINDSAPAATGKILALDVINGETTSWVIAAIKSNASAALTFFGNSATANNAADGIVLAPVTHTGNVPVIGTPLDSPINVAAADFAIKTAVGVITPTTFNDMVFTPHIKKTNTDLGTLYVSVKVSVPASDDGATGLLAYNIAAAGVITKVALPFGAVNLIGDGTLTHGIAVGDTATIRLVDCPKIDVMKTSTNAMYLIGSGGATAVGTTKYNEVWAIPLISETGPNAGKIAKDTAGPSPAGFTNDAIIEKTADFTVVTDDSAQVGGGVLPMEADGTINQLQVVGDTVYAATRPNDPDPDTATDSGGLYYSQALFDNTGRIARWSDWARILPPNESGPGTATTSFFDGSCFAAGIDTAQGRIWSVSDFSGDNADAETDNDRKTVRVNRWWASEDDADTWLIGQINSQLGDNPCYCSFDLGQHVANFGTVDLGGPSDRFAFFGTDGKVVVVATQETITTGTPTVVSSQKEFSDRTAAGTSAVSLSNGLPATAKVLSLNWTGVADAADDNYILAGTNQGLYAWTQNGTAGFRTSTDLIGTAGIAFATAGGAWVNLSTIPTTESVIRIITDTATSGTMTYILTRSNDNLTSKIYRITTPGVTATTLNTNLAVLTAISHTHFTGASTIYDIEFVGNPAASELQLAVATDAGIFISTTVGGLDGAETLGTLGALPVANVHNFALYSTDTLTHTNFIRPSHTRVPNSLSSARNTALSNASLNHTDTIMQLGVAPLLEQRENRGYVPSSGLTSTNTALADFANFGKVGGAHYNQLQQSMWTNGSLRFVISDVVNDGVNSPSNSILSVPYNLNRTGQTTRYDIMAGADLNRRKRFYWINEIAGRVMVGTESGVMSLE